MPFLLQVIFMETIIVSSAQVNAINRLSWPELLKPVQYLSRADSSFQPALLYAPVTDEPRPLLVALHTWSESYTQKMNIPYAQWCIEKQWHFIAPDFRGPNNRPAATGSDLAVEDILSAVDFARKNTAVDSMRIYLVGCSGGGFAALLLAARAPGIWAGISAWVPISDLAAWYAQCRLRGRRYADDLVTSCGGAPGTSATVDAEYRKRSPLSYLDCPSPVPLDLNAGIRDGHAGSVPVSHTLHAFNALARQADRLTPSEIDFFVAEARVPAHLKLPLNDEAYGNYPLLFRRQSGAARVSVFDGGHEILYQAALRWLAEPRRLPDGRK